MGKPKNKRMVGDNEARAVTRLLRVSPRKLNDVGDDHPRQEGRHGACRSDLLAAAHRERRREALKSAIANAENNHDLDINELVVAEAYVGKNMVMKRWSPRARGRVGRIEKFFSQLTIVVRQVEEVA